MGVRSVRTVWGTALALAVTVVASSCGHDTIELARTTGEQQQPEDAGHSSLPDAAACASNCEALSGVCVRETGECGECDTNANCSNFFSPTCNTATHECVMCRTTADCDKLEELVRQIPFPGFPELPDLPIACDTTISRCGFACQSSADCLGNPCVNGICNQCPAGACTGTSLKCLDGACVVCRNDDDCNDGAHCQLSTHTCVQCYEQSHCLPNEDCNLRLHLCFPRSQ